MKKILALMLAAALALSLVACGGGGGTGDNTPSGNNTPAETSEPQEENNTMSKDELLDTAEEVDCFDMNNDYIANSAKARLSYCDKPIQVKAYVWVVESDHVILTAGQGGQVCIDAYLSLDELASFETEEWITVVGIINDIQDLETDWGGIKVTYPHYIMDTAYLVTD